MIAAALGLQVGVPVLVLVAVVDNHVPDFLVDLMHVDQFVVHRKKEDKGFSLLVLGSEVPLQVLLQVGKLLDFLFNLSVHLVFNQINIIFLLVLVWRLMLGTRFLFLCLLRMLGLEADGGALLLKMLAFGAIDEVGSIVGHVFLFQILQVEVVLELHSLVQAGRSLRHRNLYCILLVLITCILMIIYMFFFVLHGLLFFAVFVIVAIAAGRQRIFHLKHVLLMHLFLHK